MKTVLITGANGFIARHVACRLAEEGWHVTGVSRTGEALPHYHAVFRAALGDSLSAALAAGEYDAIVHTANAAGDDEYRINVDGTLRWLDEARAAGVPLQIFLSSLSASKAAISDYGRAKHILEQRAIEMNEVVFALGVVVGNGGMYARMHQSLKGPVAPLLDGGKARIHLLGIDFLCDVIRDCISTRGEGLRGRAWRIHQPRSYTLREVLEAIRRENGLRCLLLPVPSLPALWILSLTERLTLRLPVTATNIRGLRQSRYESFDSDFENFGYPARTLGELIRQAGRLSA
jgi:nucleoside-diphosphate-sugar epimerase